MWDVGCMGLLWFGQCAWCMGNAVLWGAWCMGALRLTTPMEHLLLHTLDACACLCPAELSPNQREAQPDGQVRVCHVWQNIQVQRQPGGGPRQREGGGVRVIWGLTHAAGRGPQEAAGTRGRPASLLAHAQGVGPLRETPGLFWGAA